MLFREENIILGIPLGASVVGPMCFYFSHLYSVFS